MAREALPECVNLNTYKSYQVGYASCRRLLKFEDYCAQSVTPPVVPSAASRLLPGTSLGVDEASELRRGKVRGGKRGGGCSAGRNVFIDMGANWCNTLQLYKLVPEAAQLAWDGGAAWEVFAFEAAPLIAPFVERCCEELSKGMPLPPAVVPPAGSSLQLLKCGPARPAFQLPHRPWALRSLTL